MTSSQPDAPRPDEWRCFHCDEVFTDRLSASAHFGESRQLPPQCVRDADLMAELRARRGSK